MSYSLVVIGNPSSGVSTLFNQMTGGFTNKGILARHGIKEGPVKGHRNLQVAELPGTYSLSAYSPEDLMTREILLKDRPDAIINIIDTTRFEPSLYLTLQLLELEIPMVIALNMIDEVRNNGIELDIQKLEELLTVPVIPISASKNQGTHDLIHYALDVAKTKKAPKKIDFCDGYVHTAIHSIAHLIEEDADREGLPLRYCCSRIVEGDEPTLRNLGLQDPERNIIRHIVRDMEDHLGTDCEAAMADMRYAFIQDAAAQVLRRPAESTKERDRSIALDRILTHRILALPIFAGVMLLVFWLTFASVGEWMCRELGIAIDQATRATDLALGEAGVSPALHSLIINGIFAGVGSVLSFVPRIAVLFFLLSVLEDSGYMPRVAFIMDKLLRKIGLSGRSIVPMLIGFGCSVPAIMATRSLPSKRDRYLTIALIPFMSCSAKLPIYAVFTAALFPDHGVLAMSLIYLAGMLVSVLCALVFKHTIYKGDPVPFVLVLPNYRVPTLRSVWFRVWENAKGFIKKAFTIVFLATIVVWFLQSFDAGLNMVANPDQSLLASLGILAAPIFAPLGFGSWEASTALITGLSAKEAVVSTLAVLTGSSQGVALSQMLQGLFTPLSAASFMVFCLLYMPCVATLATIKKEMGGWRYAFGVVLFQTVLAWLAALAVYQIGGLFL